MDFLESVLGTKRDVTLRIKKACDECGGTGVSKGEGAQTTCPHCNGTGILIQSRRTPFGIMQSQTTCPHCNGTGKIVKKSCDKCKGKKYLQELINLEIETDPGVEDGQVVKIAGKGNSFNQYVGDLYIRINVKPSKIFQKSGGTIYTQVSVDPLQALTGGEIKIPTPYGFETINLPPATADGSQITLSGKGIKGGKNRTFGSSNGDLIAIIKYASPNKYSKQELKILNEIYSGNKKNKQVEKYYDAAKKEIE
ncbi:MAG: hypothetical protein MJ223_02495 [Mycoplasmoidaceae bacterium]|nr:hypothetical protein [Mycoplasmoidaceae bacterium]